MFLAAMSNSTCVSEEDSVSSGHRVQNFGFSNSVFMNNSILTNQEPLKMKKKKKRNLPGNPDPEAEVIALSPRTLLATNRYVCEVCKKGFQRDQNLQLHRRGHNLPWKLKQRNSKEVNKKKAYVCPETTCVHHHPSRALGDLTGIKKHYSRKHGEKKWKCDKCSKIYAVQSDWKAHSKTCGTREYKCDCGTIFSRKDSFITHRAFCDALAQESARLSAATLPPPNHHHPLHFHNLEHHEPLVQHPPLLPLASHNCHIPLNSWDPPPQNPDSNPFIKPETLYIPFSSPLYQEQNLMTSPLENFHVSFSGSLSATSLLQKAATMGATLGHLGSNMAHLDMMHMHHAVAAPGIWHNNDNVTRDFLGLKEDQCGGGDGGNGGACNRNAREILSFTNGGELVAYDHDRALLKHQGFGFSETYSGTWGNS
ncbi:protein indeterminate-domain 12-like isoform X1 [Primulina eburnea]|uniref:protein indeterminate-domain 12-like isoform X1 n=2 Tax=Primulina eburnea TaxID=1245227 RepID=UPI003C6BE58A